jgi:cell division protease FtsH
MDKFRNFALWVIIVLLLLALFTLFQNPAQRPDAQEFSFSQFINELDQGRVREVVIQGSEIRGSFIDSRRFQTYAPNDPTLTQRLLSRGVVVTARPQHNEVPWFVSLMLAWLPFLALTGVWIYLSRRVRPAGAGSGSANEFAALQRQVEDLKREIENLKESQKPTN